MRKTAGSGFGDSAGDAASSSSASQPGKGLTWGSFVLGGLFVMFLDVCSSGLVRALLGMLT